MLLRSLQSVSIAVFVKRKHTDVILSFASHRASTRTQLWPSSLSKFMEQLYTRDTKLSCYLSSLTLEYGLCHEVIGTSAEGSNYSDPGSQIYIDITDYPLSPRFDSIMCRGPPFLDLWPYEMSYLPRLISRG